MLCVFVLCLLSCNVLPSCSLVMCYCSALPCFAMHLCSVVARWIIVVLCRVLVSYLGVLISFIVFVSRSVFASCVIGLQSHCFFFLLAGCVVSFVHALQRVYVLS